ncbi:VNG_1110C family protein [Halobaculum sp. D14]|uniref:VNG_1110C family protein n=1 Tax=unclassified Halobaculum TaxID=2640896 RepID=UPI003EB9EF44
MPDPSRLRDSTQIVLPCDALDGVRTDLEAEFTVTVFSVDDAECRIIGSPVEIKAVSEFLARHGVTLP